MSNWKDLIEAAGKYVIALIVVIGCFILIYQGRGDQVQPWTVTGLVVGWIIRDSAANSATSNVSKIVSASQGTTG